MKCRLVYRSNAVFLFLFHYLPLLLLLLLLHLLVRNSLLLKSTVKFGAKTQVGLFFWFNFIKRDSQRRSETFCCTRWNALTRVASVVPAVTRPGVSVFELIFICSMYIHSTIDRVNTTVATPWIVNTIWHHEEGCDANEWWHVFTKCFVFSYVWQSEVRKKQSKKKEKKTGQGQ